MQFMSPVRPAPLLCISTAYPTPTFTLNAQTPLLYFFLNLLVATSSFAIY
jgi:hypothetical protein